VNREERLRRELPGAADDMIAELSRLPVAEVSRYLAVARQAKRDALAHDRELRRQRKADDRAHGNYDEQQLADRNIRMLEATARRASGGQIAALAALAGFKREIPALERMAVMALRAQGVSDAQIARSMGVTRYSVGERFGRRGAHTQDRPASGPEGNGAEVVRLSL
jgi:hypothetical protein